ncbi:uncharacterized protein LOC132797833 [Drosophila nasuta]|uniref:uncharacterized protein LOC132797833 n=1 Tax=Drosophila nasuta TaxID=42062 RepID=UPI00295E985A|nr:uncharacterized protein LOC132797833 [Drosophila nasuta]
MNINKTTCNIFSSVIHGALMLMFTCVSSQSYDDYLNLEALMMIETTTQSKSSYETEETTQVTDVTQPTTVAPPQVTDLTQPTTVAPPQEMHGWEETCIILAASVLLVGVFIYLICKVKNNREYDVQSAQRV